MLVTQSPQEREAWLKKKAEEEAHAAIHRFSDDNYKNKKMKNSNSSSKFPGQLDPEDCGPYNLNCTPDYYADYIAFHGARF